jgi:hypothetical protein
MAQSHNNTPIGTTLLFSRNSVALTDGQLVTVPASGGVAIPSQFTKSLILTIGLSDADKLAVGKTLQLSGFISTDGGATFNFVNGFTWTSYGPNGLTVTDPDGTVHVNPDPRLFMPLNGQTGLRAQLTYLANGLSNAAVTVFGVN